MFGARMMVRGFLLNNQLTDFSFAPLDRRPTGRQPRAARQAAAQFDGADAGVRSRQRRAGRTLGSPGGSQIIGYVAKTLVGIARLDLDIQQAIAMPNFGSRNGPTEVEKGRIAPR